MANCEICNDYNEDHVDNMAENEAHEKRMEASPQYKPNLYFYWHGDIEEDYDMGDYECLCSRCFNQQDYEGKITWKEVSNG
tara:strand:+ start:124 stop:366 length:243 start_codon:yes stop_codon:yes gene_type:complete